MTLAKVITLDNFDGGEYSQLGPWRAAPNQWTGTNLVRYPDGSIGPRYGLKEISITGISPTGAVLGLGYNFAADAGGFKDTFFVIGTDVHVFNRDDGAGFTCATSLGETATSPIPWAEKSVSTFLSVPGGKMYTLTHATTCTITAHTASSTVFSPGLTCLTFYGERLVASGSGKAPDGTTAPGNRVYYSTAGSPTAWTSTNYFDVGHGPAVTALLVHRENLLIATSDGKWWVSRGTLGSTNQVLREIIQGVSPNEQWHWAALGDGQVAYVLGSAATGSIGSVGHFSGTSVRLLDHILFGAGRNASPATEPAFTVQPLKEPGDFFIQGGTGNAPNDVFALVRGVPTIQEWGASPTLAGFVSSFMAADFHIVTDAGASGVAPKFYRWRAYATRPGFAGDSDAQPGDASTNALACTFETAGFHAPDGMQMMVRSVTVDFKAWQSGAGNNNTLTCVVDALDVWEGTTASSAAQSLYDAAPSGVSTSGTQLRRTLNFGDQGWGNGFKLRFTTVRGVAIQKIQVHVTYRPSPGQEG